MGVTDSSGPIFERPRRCWTSPSRSMRIISASLIGLALLTGRTCVGGTDDYVRKIKPLLAAHCVSCHGVERPKAGLRLDTAAAAIRGGRGGPSVVPGKADESPLYLAIIGEGDVDRMPLK